MFLIPSHIRKTLGSVLTESAHDGPHTGLILLPHGQVLCSINNGDEDWESGSVGQSSGGSGDDRDDEGEGESDGDEDDEGSDDGDEPYIPTPERNRMLRGIVNTQLLESNAFPILPSSSSSAEGAGKRRSSLKIECELGRILAYPLSLPIPTPSNSTSSSSSGSHNPTNFSHPDPRIRHLTSTPNLSPQSLTYTLSALGLEDGNGNSGEDQVGDVERDHLQQQQQQVGVVGGKREGVLVLVLNGTRDLDWENLKSAAKSFEKEFRTKLSSSGA